jgi:hypothetical protein
MSAQSPRQDLPSFTALYASTQAKMQKTARTSAALRLTSRTPQDCTAATPLALKGFSLDDQKGKPPDQGSYFP